MEKKANPALFPKGHGMYLLHYFTVIHHSLTRQKSISENYLGFIFHLEISKSDSSAKMLWEEYWLPQKWLKIFTLDISKLYIINIPHIQSVHMCVYI